MSHCFLCGELLEPANRTDEHVFPTWLQNSASLWNQEIVLLNRTSIPYGNLKIPCCHECNTGPLSEIEREVSSAFGEGYNAVAGLQKERLWQWCSKILYGILFRELSLLFDRSSPEEGSILDPEMMEPYWTQHLFLQSIRLPFEFVGFVPYSLFLVQTHTYGEPQVNFDYLDTSLVFYPKEGVYRNYPSMAIRFNGIGVICIVEDNGAQQEFMSDEYERYEGLPLHPVQFVELATMAMYKNTLLAYIPHYTTAQDQTTGACRVLWHRPHEPYVWRDWDNEQYAQVLAARLRESSFIEDFQASDVSVGNGRTLTFLRNPDDSVPRYEPYTRLRISPQTGS